MSTPGPPVVWELRIFDHGGNLVGIPQCMPRIGRFLDAAGYMNADIALVDPMARIEKIQPDLHDWGVYRNGVKLEGGMITSVAVDTDNRLMQVTGATWLAYLQTRVMEFDPTSPMNVMSLSGANPVISATNVMSVTFSNCDLFDIVRAVMKYVLDDPATSIPVTYDSVDSGVVLPVINLDATDNADILSRITDFSQQTPGFDFEFDPDCGWHMYAPEKGGHVDAYTLDLERNIVSVNSYQNSGIRGNRIFATGTGTGSSAAQVLRQNTGSQRSRRKKDIVQDAGNIMTRAVLVNFANTVLSLSIQDQISFSVRTKIPSNVNVWGMMEPGDSIRVEADLEYDKLTGYHKILSMESDPTDQGDDFVTFTFGPSPLVA